MNTKYVYVGSRCFVYNKMIELGCEVVKTFVVRDSHMETLCSTNNYDYCVIESKEQLVLELEKIDFDVLISNGCPYILPISKLHTSDQLFINIHPSLLPDLRGNSPVNGAILFNRPHGVTCHVMTDDIDDGDIVAQIEIPLTEDIDLETLYYITFFSEGVVFESAHMTGFTNRKKNTINKNSIYYTRQAEDLYINKNQNIDEIIKRVRAFSVEGQFARFVKRKDEFLVERMDEITNSYVRKMFEKSENNTIVAIVNKKKIMVKFNGRLFILKMVTDVSDLQESSTWLD